MQEAIYTLQDTYSRHRIPSIRSHPDRSPIEVFLVPSPDTRPGDFWVLEIPLWYGLWYEIRRSTRNGAAGLRFCCKSPFSVARSARLEPAAF
jgi:hypothetical protein